MLRRLAALLTTNPRPLVVFTSKSLLRDPQTASSLDDLMAGTLQTVLDDVVARERAVRITRLVLCSGKYI